MDEESAYPHYFKPILHSRQKNMHLVLKLCDPLSSLSTFIHYFAFIMHFRNQTGTSASLPE